MKKLIFLLLIALPLMADAQFVILKTDTLTNTDGDVTIINTWRVDTTYAIVVYAQHTTEITTPDTTYDKYEKKHYAFRHNEYPMLFDTVFVNNHKILLLKAIRQRVKTESDFY